MLYFARLSSMIAFFWTVFLLPDPVTGASIMFMVVTFATYALLTVHEYQAGKQHDRDMGR